MVGIPEDVLRQIEKRHRKYEELRDTEVTIPGTLWASYVPRYRKGNPSGFKVHNAEHLARSAVKMLGGTGNVYFLCGGTWMLYEVWVDGMELHR